MNEENEVDEKKKKKLEDEEKKEEQWDEKETKENITYERKCQRLVS